MLKMTVLITPEMRLEQMIPAPFQFELCLFNHTSLTVKQCKVNKFGDEEKPDCLGFFPLFLDGEQKKGEKKASRKTRNSSWKRGQTSFHKSSCLISDRVTSDYGLTVADYIIPSEVVY